MKTKKDILKWWEEAGRMVADYDDYKDFWQKIDKSIKVKEKKKEEGKNQWRVLILSKTGWKNSLWLFFYNQECYKISGF